MNAVEVRVVAILHATDVNSAGHVVGATKSYTARGGEVVSAWVAETELGDVEVGECVARRVRELLFDDPGDCLIHVDWADDVMPTQLVASPEAQSHAGRWRR